MTKIYTNGLLSSLEVGKGYLFKIKYNTSLHKAKIMKMKGRLLERLDNNLKIRGPGGCIMTIDFNCILWAKSIDDNESLGTYIVSHPIPVDADSMKFHMKYCYNIEHEI